MLQRIQATLDLTQKQFSFSRVLPSLLKKCCFVWRSSKGTSSDKKNEVFLPNLYSPSFSTEKNHKISQFLFYLLLFLQSHPLNWCKNRLLFIYSGTVMSPNLNKVKNMNWRPQRSAKLVNVSLSLAAFFLLPLCIKRRNQRTKMFALLSKLTVLFCRFTQ